MSTKQMREMIDRLSEDYDVEGDEPLSSFFTQVYDVMKNAGESVPESSDASGIENAVAHYIARNVETAVIPMLNSAGVDVDKTDSLRKHLTSAVFEWMENESQGFNN